MHVLHVPLQLKPRHRHSHSHVSGTAGVDEVTAAHARLEPLHVAQHLRNWLPLCQSYACYHWMWTQPTWSMLPSLGTAASMGCRSPARLYYTNTRHLQWLASMKAHSAPAPVLPCCCFACTTPAACPACVLAPHLYAQLEAGGVAPCHKLRLKHSHNPLGVGCFVQEIAAHCQQQHPVGNSFKCHDCCAWQRRHI